MEKTENYIGNHTEEPPAIDSSVTAIDPATGEPDWVLMAKSAYNTSTDYFDNNIRKQIEKNISLFRSKHPDGSKYYQDSYRYRSKLFRPKVRGMTRRHEAAAALAYFATQDAVSCTPEDSDDEASVMGAKFGKKWLEYRLEHSIKWFKTVIGAYQDAMTQGIVISRQEWLYSEREYEVEVEEFGNDGLVNLDNTGQIVMKKEKRTEITKDKPNIHILPLENFRFSAAADWRDPVNASPFLIELIPMFVCHVKERMKADDKKTGEKRWVTLTDEEIMSNNNKDQAYDSTRTAREGKREDSLDQTHSLRMFDIVWVHRNIVEFEGQDYLFYTLGTEKLLSTPVPLETVFLHGRPYTMGSAVIETHRNYPSGVGELAQDLQLEANDLSNQTLDNIKLINNKRYRGRRGSNTDWRALTTSVPGGVILMDDLNDVKEESFTDLSGSAFQTQDRNNADFDEIVGNFSNGSVQTNRSLNETVGGMAMQLDDSNVITEYQLRVFTESWVEDTLRMLMDMGKYYESDERVLKIIGGNASPEAVVGLMDTAYGVKVAIGFGATSPHKRIEKLSIGLKTISEFMPDEMRNINGDEIKSEIFGALGYRDGTRFFTKRAEGDNPEVDELNRKVQELTQIIEGKKAEKQADNEAKIQVAQIREDGQMQRQVAKLDHDYKLQMINVQLEYIAHQLTAEGLDIDRGELILQQEALQWQKATMIEGKKEEQIAKLTDEDNQLSTVLMNDRYGMVPNAEDKDDGKKKELNSDA